jgi:pyrroloquinoline quinone biosynthesis protein D
MKPELSASPRLLPGVRMNENSQQEPILLMPERVLKLNPSSVEIVSRCNGKNTVQQIAGELHQLYAAAEPERITRDLLNYLEILHEARAIDF